MTVPNGVTITKGARWAALGLLVLTLIVGGGNLLATHSEVQSAQAAQRREQAAQRRQGQQIERKLCTSLDRLAALRPPVGNPKVNPSRAYEQGQHAILAQLGPDIGCKRGEGG